MPGIELHADFDRDGRITGSQVERLARRWWPGAIAVPNVDRDARRLPPARATRRPSILAPDSELPAPGSRDDELVRLEVRVASGSLAPSDRLRIRCRTMPGRLRFQTTDGEPVLEHFSVAGDFELPALPRSGTLALNLQVLRPAGSSWQRDADLGVRYRSDLDEDSRFELAIVRVNADGLEFVEDGGCFTVAPVILADSTAPVARLYIVDSNSNLPSVSDVRDAAAAAGARLEVVQPTTAGMDVWIQDQYQVAQVQGVRGTRQLVWHLPRYRAPGMDAAMVDTLAEFVDSHFRSRNVGLDRSLRTRELVVPTVDGGERRLEHAEVGECASLAYEIRALATWIHKLTLILDPAYPTRMEGDILALSRQLTSLWTDLVNAAERSRQSLPAEQRRDELAYFLDIRRDVLDVIRPFRVTESEVQVTLRRGGFTLDHETARRLIARADQMTSTAVYGGNIESTPPVAGAPLGKILLGNRTDPASGAEFVDPDVLRFLARQRKQPIVELDTTWLEVGHVDEILAVVPHTRASFSILHASTGAAMGLLREAVALHRSGLTGAVPADSPPAGDRPRLMSEGEHPVTRALRGKPWLHSENPVGPIRPPSAFLVLADAFMRSPENHHGIGLIEPRGTQRYLAEITAAELIHCERDSRGESTNDAIDRARLRANREVLTRELGAPVLPIPVLFDRVTDTRDYEGPGEVGRTSALLPNMCNLTVLDGHLLVPRPYGPRMLTDDAIDVVRRVMSASGMPGTVRARVGRRLVARHRMTRVVTWVVRFPGAAAASGAESTPALRGLWSASDVVEAFRDSFPGREDAEIERRVVHANRRKFNASGALNERFSRLVFDDGMVDLFELWMTAVSEELGVTLHFVDSWDYHLRLGEIHCGTNVLRRPRRIGGIDSWDAPDHEFRSTHVRAPAPVG